MDTPKRPTLPARDPLAFHAPQCCGSLTPHACLRELSNTKGYYGGMQLRGSHETLSSRRTRGHRSIRLRD